VQNAQKGTVVTVLLKRIRVKIEGHLMKFEKVAPLKLYLVHFCRLSFLFIESSLQQAVNVNRGM